MNPGVRSSAPLKVLIVEDTKTITSLIQVYLMGWGLEFHDAGNGVLGLARARSLRPDLIISDVQMPEMDGFALCAAIRADPALSKTPIVMLTSLKDEASRQKGRLVGATAFLNKPVSLDELREKVRTLLRLPDNQKATRSDPLKQSKF